MGNSNSKNSSSIPSVAPGAKSLSDFYLGQSVVLKGTGRRWTGANWVCKIVDLSQSDKTVKVQFQDGGYKRFPLEQFTEILDLNTGSAERAAPPTFGSQAYEWYFENYAPDSDHVEAEIAGVLEELRNDISKATRAGDFAKAAELHAKFKNRQEMIVEGFRLKESLLTAIQNHDFKSAAETQDKLKNFQMKRKKSISDGKGSEADNSVSSAALTASGPKEPKPMKDVIANAGKRALGGGIAGAAAMVVQVSTLMWIRTIMNYQYRYGTSLGVATKTLYADGGLLRFYRGYGAAMAQGPLSRFGDTAANAGILSFMDANPTTAALPAAVKTIGASGAAATWRIFLTPIDTVKTILQVEGQDGMNILRDKVKLKGPSAYYHGALAAAAATFVGHYPWFATYNTLQEKVPQYDERWKKLCRNAGIGFVSSVVSDTISNSLRVVKTYRQTSRVPVTYYESTMAVVEKDGWVGLFGRGLKTRILANGMQGLMFSVMWKEFDAMMKKQGVF